MTLASVLPKQVPTHELCKLAMGAYTLIYSSVKNKANVRAQVGKEGEVPRDPPLSFVWNVFGDILNYIKRHRKRA